MDVLHRETDDVHTKGLFSLSVLLGHHFIRWLGILVGVTSSLTGHYLGTYGVFLDFQGV